MHDLPKRAHRWHRLAACAVHFTLAAVHATQALLLAGDGVALMMSEEAGEERTLQPSWIGRTGTSGPERVVNPPIVYGVYKVK